MYMNDSCDYDSLVDYRIYERSDNLSSRRDWKVRVDSYSSGSVSVLNEDYDNRSWFRKVIDWIKKFVFCR